MMKPDDDIKKLNDDWTYVVLSNWKRYLKEVVEKSSTKFWKLIFCFDEYTSFLKHPLLKEHIKYIDDISNYEKCDSLQLILISKRSLVN
jgi:hypothetical protein